MATLEATLTPAPSTQLVWVSITVIDAHALDGDCAVTIRDNSVSPGPPHRCASLAEVVAYLAHGAVPGVRGDERDWAPIQAAARHRMSCWPRPQSSISSR